MSRMCCIVACGTKHPDTGPNKRTLFEVPKDPARHERWIRAISPFLKKGRRSRKHLYVCELHFEEDDVLRDFTVNSDNELVSIIQRARIDVTQTAVPCIFNKRQRNVVSQSNGNAKPDEHNTVWINEASWNVTDSSIPVDSPDVKPSLSLDSASCIAQYNATQPTDPLAKIQGATYNINDLDIFGIENIDIKYGNWVGMKRPTGLLFQYMGDLICYPSRYIFIKKDMSVEIRAHNNIANVDILKTVTSLQDVFSAMLTIGRLKVCQGVDNSIHCPTGFFEPPPNSRTDRCTGCRDKRKKKFGRENMRYRRTIQKFGKKEKCVKSLRQIKKLERLDSKFRLLKDTLEQLKEECSKTLQNTIDEMMLNFPPTLKAAVNTIVTASKCKGPSGMRYTHDWILECILLRIKSRRVYLHVRSHSMMIVPSIETLNSYVKSMKPMYGFCPKVFELLKAQAQTMEPEERRGIIILDEMKISEALSFDRDNLLFKGFTDIGEHSPENHKTIRGDHALVILFQPFRGKWVQTVGTFLTKGCANSTLLHKIVMEGIIMLENAFFFVDAVMTDGATWNRTMVNKFGLTEDDASCSHPCSNDSDVAGRRLWFFSDFSHLITNLRNFLVSQDVFMTPDGMVKKTHFQAILECHGGQKNFNMKIAHQLTPDHLNPKYYQKMNLPMAFQLFSPRVSAAMIAYKQLHKGLEDSDSTVTFIKRIQNLIVAMSARTPKHALAPGSESYKTIMEFREYLDSWKQLLANTYLELMSANTFHGLKVTLKAAVEIMTFLTTTCGFEYLMTRRLNQDALETFLCMVRSACGSSYHPESLLFIQVNRLMTLYSPVKPPKGSKVEGCLLFETLLSSDDMEHRKESKKKWSAILDKMVERGENAGKVHDILEDHAYSAAVTSDCVEAYFAGFVANRIGKLTNCGSCQESIIEERGHAERDMLMNHLSEGFMKYPSDSLLHLASAVERAILKIVVGTEELSAYTFMHIAQNIMAEDITFVGCPIHKKELTKTVIKFYAITRSQIMCKKYICSEYFEESNYIIKDIRMDVPLGKRYLKEDVVATINVVSTSSGRLRREEMLKRRGLLEGLRSYGLSKENVVPDQEDSAIEPMEILNEYVHILHHTKETRMEKVIQEKEVQTEVDINCAREMRVIRAEAEARRWKTVAKKKIEKEKNFKAKEVHLKRMFTPGQYKRLGKRGTNSNWSSEDIASAMSLYSSGPRCYQLLRKRGFPLPVPSRLRQWAAKLKLKRK